MSNRFAPLFAVMGLLIGLAVGGTASAQVVYAEATTAPTTTYTQTTGYAEEDVMRVRLGGDLGIGVALADNGTYGLLTATGRIGLQLDDLIGVYYQIGLWAVGLDTGFAYEVFGIWTNTANIDFTFADVVRVGVGAGVDVFGWTYEIFPAVEGHAELLLGSVGPGPRAGFVLGVRVHTAVDLRFSNVGVLFMPSLFAGFEFY